MHGDVKSDNVMLLAGDSRRAVLTDLALALPIERARRFWSMQKRRGTLAYMAPEQLGSVAPIDTTVDIYAVGVVFFELLVGRLPFRSGEPARSARRRSTVMPPLDSFPALPSGIEQFLTKCLQRDPAARYPDASIALQAFESLVNAAESVDIATAAGCSLSPDPSPCTARMG